MKHQIKKPNGEIYAEVWSEDGRLRMVLPQYSPNMQIQIDEKIIPQLIAALQAIEQAEQAQPVAVVSGYYGGQCVIMPINPAMIFNSGTAFYTSPPPRQPLTDEQCDEAIRRSGLWTLACTVPQNLAMLRGLCREAAHGIKGEA